MKNRNAFFLRTGCAIAILALLTTSSFAQLVDIIANPNASGNNVFGTRLYAASEAIYTEAEIGANNFTNVDSAINQIGFNISTVGANPTISNITIWMKEVPLTSVDFTTGTYSTDGYTQVFTGTVNASTLGWVPIALTTPFQRTVGHNLQVLIERKDGVAHTGYVYRSANGNNTGAAVVSTRRYNDNTALSAATSLTGIATRAQIRLQHVVPSDALVQEIYSLGKLPVPFASPHVIKANISNVGSNALTNLPVTLTITGANNFTDVQTIPSLAPGTSIDVSFAPFTSVTAQGNDSISVTIPNDDYNSNNRKSVLQVLDNHTYSYSYGSVPLSAVGFNASTGDFAVRFNTNAATAISQVSVNFIAGGQPFQVGIWDTVGGNGKPGRLLYSSAIQTSTTGVYILPILPAVPITAGDFFVGVQQVGTTNVSFAYQNEDPIRLNTFFLTQPTGGTVWTDLAPANRFRFMIDPKLQLAIDASVARIVPPAAVCASGPVSYGTVISNVGFNPIAAGAASVRLSIGGANSFSGTSSNTAIIPSGGSETVYFNSVNIPNAGTNNDTVFVSLANDLEPLNDTLVTTDVVAAPVIISSFPAIENVEAALPLFPYIRTVAGSIPLWRVQIGNYSNANQATPLAPHAGARFFLFDGFGGGNSAGSVTRLSSNCIGLPASGASGCGYSVSFWMSHDNINTRPGADSLYVSVSTDNGVTWTRLLPGYSRLNASFTSPGWERLSKDLSAYAGQTIQVGFEGTSGYGNVFGLDDISIGSNTVQELTLATTANNGIQLTKQCDEQGWTYYADPATPAKPLFAINWDPSGTGANVAAKAAAVPSLQLDPTYFAAEDVPGKMATYTMKRYWNVNAGATALTGPVNLRFFYDSTEKKAVDDAAAAFANTNAGTLEPGTWFKTTGAAFAGDAAHVSPDGVLNDALPLDNINVSNGTANGILYAQFDGVTGFSGGTYASGVGPSTPLPVTLASFEAKRSGKVNELSWRTSLELNTKKFIVERSADGRSFSQIGEVKATGNGAGARQYSFTDNDPLQGTNYYRLRIIDINNTGKYSVIRSLRNEAGIEVGLYPNPAKTALTVKISSDKAQKGQLTVNDASGRILLSQEFTLAAGTNTVAVKVNQLVSGAYVLKVSLSDNVVIRKFDKQ